MTAEEALAGMWSGVAELLAEAEAGGLEAGDLEADVRSLARWVSLAAVARAPGEDVLKRLNGSLEEQLTFLAANATHAAASELVRQAVGRKQGG